jgi:hypothetical protein
MYKLKSLQWKQHEKFNCIYAEPYGLAWKYYITTLKNGAIEFALLNNNYEYEFGFPEIYSSINEAQEKALQHYLSTIEQLVELSPH